MIKNSGFDIRNGTAAIGDILTGKTAYSGGGKIIGGMPNNGAVNITPGVSPQSILAGYHNGAGNVAGDGNLLSANILNGKTIFGVSGNVIPMHVAAGTVQSGSTAYQFTAIQGSQYGFYLCTINIGFIPKMIVLLTSYSLGNVAMHGGTIYQDNFDIDGGSYPGRITMFDSNFNCQVWQFKETVNPASIGTTTALPVRSPLNYYTWYAIG